jgi:hypothetical protein
VQLGVDYQLRPYVDFGHPTVAALVTSAPDAGSAAGQIRLTSTGQVLALEPGDLIIAMDEMVFFNRDDLDGHTGQTNLYFRDSRSGLFQVAATTLPDAVTPSKLASGDARRGELNMNPPRLLGGRFTAPFARNQPELRGLLLQSIRDGEVRLTPPQLRDRDGTMATSWSTGAEFTIGMVHETASQQALVEALRSRPHDPDLLRYLTPSLANVERLIDRKLGLLNQGQTDQPRTERIDQQITFQYLWAVYATAAARGVPVPLEAKPPSPSAGAPFAVQLTSQRGATSVQYMPRLNWWIITRSQNRQPEEREWSTCNVGDTVRLTGYYAYITRYADGSSDAARTDLHVARDGTFSLP